jgi:hypothetical protein
METTVKLWLDKSRKKLQAGNFTEADLQRLEMLLIEPRQMVLYLYSKSTNMRSAIASWALYDPTVSYEPTLPSQDTPYDSVIEAVNDGWRIVQFPRAELYQFSDVDNTYLGYEFILEKSTSDL